MRSSPTEFEREVMEMLLAGENPVLAILREQFAASDVVNCEFTGAGFYTTFSVPEGAPGFPGERLSTSGTLALTPQP